MSTRHALGEAPCSIARALDALGDAWSILIVRDVFHGVRRYDALHASVGAATNILAARLRRLLGAGILERRRYQEHPPRYEYALTQKGRDLYPLLVALLQWGDRYERRGTRPPRVLRHDDCGGSVTAHLVCDGCGGTITGDNVRTIPAHAA